jgi:hypothetical protein
MARRPVEWVVAARHREEGEGPSSGLAWAEVSQELGQLQKNPRKNETGCKNCLGRKRIGLHSKILNLIQGFEFKTKSFKLDLNQIQTSIIQINLLRTFQIWKF